jgi:predicted CXXCH cytochrome family protein
VQGKRFNTLWAYIAVAGILIVVISGCSRQTKHKVLTFFFTGVPPLEAEKKPVKKIDTSEVKKKGAEKGILYSHTPWASGKCDQCHKGATGFGVPGQKGPLTVFHKGGGMPGELVLPKKELCIKCHDAMSVSKAYTEGLWLHTCTEEGECNACHDPHQSNNPNQLLEKPEKICISCHTEGKIIKLAEQCKIDDCLSCHNPHLGKDRLRLKKDYKEVPQKVTFNGDQPPAQRAYGPEGDRESGVGDQELDIIDQGSGNKAIQ